METTILQASMFDPGIVSVLKDSLSIGVIIALATVVVYLFREYIRYRNKRDEDDTSRLTEELKYKAEDLKLRIEQNKTLTNLAEANIKLAQLLQDVRNDIVDHLRETEFRLRENILSNKNSSNNSNNNSG